MFLLSSLLSSVKVSFFSLFSLTLLFLGSYCLSEVFFSKMAFVSAAVSPVGCSSSSTFSPKPGDLVLARWVEDGVFYRAMFLRVVDSKYSLLNFLDYGTGLSRSDDLCEGLACLPTNCLVDQYLQREFAYALRMQRRLESAARVENLLDSSP